jgi:hypothetical protein
MFDIMRLTHFCLSFVVMYQGAILRDHSHWSNHLQKVGCPLKQANQYDVQTFIIFVPVPFKY